MKKVVKNNAATEYALSDSGMLSEKGKRVAREFMIKTRRRKGLSTLRMSSSTSSLTTPWCRSLPGGL